MRRNFAKRVFTIYEIDPKQTVVLQQILDKLNLPNTTANHSRIIGIRCEDPVKIPADYQYEDAARDLLSLLGYVPGIRHNIVKYYLPNYIKDVQMSSEKAFDPLHTPDLCHLLDLAKKDKVIPIASSKSKAE